ncbi:LAMI_0B01926g1_1 [Lachancea mirantina]|uniref:LAMI_0B01926g1_1 n=1 Tax=Lachancea mirantina TaxID=1230905 RepID=A0A1G4ITN0_9SACH|nr:LAMI_0B01926g1_1 [Lachancea mirantina]
MSAQQIRRCISDILGISADDSSSNWNQGRLKKLQSTTSTLYNISLSKVMLKQNEEIGRAHICAYLATERLAEKHEPGLRYYSDKIPLEPRHALKVMELFKTALLKGSPAKQINWSPSPKKSLSPVKNAGRFTSMNPDDLRRQLFGTPTKSDVKSATPKIKPADNHEESSRNEKGPKDASTRRRLVFEDEDPDPAVDKGGLRGKSIELQTSNGYKVDSESSPVTPRKRAKSTQLSAGSPKKSRFQDTPYRSELSGSGDTANRGCLLYKKYCRATPSEIVELCNHFEIPSEITYRILDKFSEHATYLVYPFRLVCGLILNCCQVIFSDKRKQDPRIDEYLFKKMGLLVKTSNFSEMKECMKMVREIIDGEKWYRALKVKHNFYDGVAYEEAIAIRLGNMLQRSSNIATEEQYTSWKHKTLTDLTLRDGFH